MRHIGVERFDARDAEHDRAEYGDARQPVMREKATTYVRIERPQRGGILDDAERSRARRSSANQSSMIGPKTMPIRAVPRLCTRNSADEDADRDRHDERLRVRRRDGEPSTDESTETAGVMMPSPKSMPAPRMIKNVSHVGGGGTPRFDGRQHEREQREDAAFAVVRDAHDHPDVANEDDENQRPENQAQQMPSTFSCVGVDVAAG